MGIMLSFEYCWVFVDDGYIGLEFGTLEVLVLVVLLLQEGMQSHQALQQMNNLSIYNYI